MPTTCFRVPAARLGIVTSLLALVCLGCGGGGGPSTSGATLDGAWTSVSFGGHATVIFLRERADGRVLGYLPADPSALLTGGLRLGDAVVLAFSQEDPGISASGTFSGTLSADGATLAGQYDDGGGPVPVTFTRPAPALAIEHWLIVDFDNDQLLRASRLRDGAAAYVTGGFVGVDGCGFLACAGDLASWSIVGDAHALTSSSSGPCPSTSSLMGTWSATDKLVMGTYTTTNCNGPVGGNWGAGRVGSTTTADVLATLHTVADMLDAFEAESLTVLDALTNTYLHDGRTKPDLQAELMTMFADFDDLEASATVREVISANTGEEFPDIAAPPRLEWRLVVTGVPSAGGAREVVADLDTAVNDQEDLRWIALDAGAVKFSGSGYATPFEIEMPIVLADSTNMAYGIWPWGVHGGGHPEGHPGWDVEYVSGGLVRAVADGTVSAVRAKEEPEYAGQYEVTVAHRPGRSTRYDHLENVRAGIVVGASVVTGQVLADAGQVGTIHLTHFAVVSAVDAVCPEPFLSPAARALFDTIWADAVYNEEFCEPLPCNPTDVTFPLTRGWNRETGSLAPRIEFTRLAPTTSDYRYTLRDAIGTLLETGTLSYNTHGVPYSTLDLVPDGVGATHLAIYDIVGDTMQIAWNDVLRPASLAGAGQYRFAP